MIKITTLPTVTAEMMDRETIMFQQEDLHGFFQEKNADRFGSHLRLSCKNRSDGPVGSFAGIETAG